MTQEDQVIVDLARRAAQGCSIQFQTGEPETPGWFELVGGEDDDSLLELLETHGDRGLVELRAQFEPLLEERLQEQIGYYDEQFNMLLEGAPAGGPYSSRELDRAASRGVDTSELATIEDYDDAQGMRDRYISLRDQYQRGQPIEVFVSLDSSARRIPNGDPVVFEKPAERSQQGKPQEVGTPSA